MTRKHIYIGDMSRETAIGILKLMLEAMETYDSISPKPERINAVKTVIKALEQEPTTKNDLAVDCISRKRVLEWLENATDDSIEHAIDSNLEFIPSVTPQPRWIPVSERLPEEETNVLICNKNGDIELSRGGSYSTEVENYFMWYTSGWRFGKVIAWMPLPKPYEPQESEDKEDKL